MPPGTGAPPSMRAACDQSTEVLARRAPGPGCVARECRAPQKLGELLLEERAPERPPGESSSFREDLRRKPRR
eukprot:3791471-Alexandrium_andersonii.AAC.1